MQEDSFTPFFIFILFFNLFAQDAFICIFSDSHENSLEKLQDNWLNDIIEYCKSEENSKIVLVEYKDDHQETDENELNETKKYFEENKLNGLFRVESNKNNLVNEILQTDNIFHFIISSFHSKDLLKKN